MMMWGGCVFLLVLVGGSVPVLILIPGTGTGTGSKQTVPGTSWSNTWYGRYLVLPVPVFNKLVGSSRITEYFYSILKTRGNKYRAPSCVLLLSPRKLHTLVIIRFVLDTFLARFIYSNM